MPDNSINALKLNCVLLYFKKAVDGLPLRENIGNNGINFARPWSREDFIKRLRTFKAVTWFAKPDKISPVECARFGWENSGYDELRCSFCECILSHNSNDPDGTQLHAALSTDHRSYCGWKINCCDLSLLSLARVPNDVEIGHFKTSLTSLLDNALSPVLEKLNLVLPSPMSNILSNHHSSPSVMDPFRECIDNVQVVSGTIQEIMEELKVSDLNTKQLLEGLVVAALKDACGSESKLADYTSSLPVTPSPRHVTAFALCLFGWSKCDLLDDNGTQSDSTGLGLYCLQCDRRVLINTPSSSQSRSINAEVGGPAPPSSFNVILQHNSWCPYICSWEGQGEKTNSLLSPHVGWKRRLGILHEGYMGTGPVGDESQPVTPEQVYKRVRTVLDPIRSTGTLRGDEFRTT